MHTTGIRARLISVISCAIPPRSPLLVHFNCARKGEQAGYYRKLLRERGLAGWEAPAQDMHAWLRAMEDAWDGPFCEGENQTHSFSHNTL